MTDTLAYIVNFANSNGFAIVNARSAFNEVIAFIEHGNLTPGTEIDNPGFRMFLNGLAKLYFNPMDSLFHPFIHDTTQIVYTDPIIPELTIYEWRTIDSKQPLLYTQWGQRDPFNRYCSTIYGQQSPTGCLPLATAQVVAFHQHPISYNSHVYDWSEILLDRTPASYYAEEMTAQLIHDIGQLEQTTYGVNESYNTSLLDAIECWNAFGYDYTFGMYQIDSCITDLSNNLPILTSGETQAIGHSWVIDGYLIRQLYNLVNICPVPGQLRKYVHCNWGWDGHNNGYFLSEAFCPSDREFTAPEDNGIPMYDIPYDFSTNLRVFYHIKPSEE